MLVPTVPLVEQQVLALSDYLQNYVDENYLDEGGEPMPYWVDGLSGAESGNVGKRERFLSSDICVITPQILM